MLIGLTGNFGSGKSAVLGIFRKIGAITVNSDDIVHKLLKDNHIKEKIVSLLGDILDSIGEINRKKTAEIIFNNNKLKSALESLLHPHVMSEIKQIGDRNKNSVVIAEIPLLFEGGFNKDVDKIITVFNQRRLIYERLEKMGFSEKDIKRRLSLQMPDDKKKDISDFLVDNSGSIEDTEIQVKKIFEKLCR